MRRIDSLDDFLRGVDERKKSLGITDDMIVDARNNGQRRTPEKRRALRRIQDRAKAEGVAPLPANY